MPLVFFVYLFAIVTARPVCGAGFVKRSRVRLSVCLSVPSLDSKSGMRAFAAERPAGRDVDRQLRAPAFSVQQRRRSTALSSKCGQRYVDLSEVRG